MRVFTIASFILLERALAFSAWAPGRARFVSVGTCAIKNSESITPRKEDETPLDDGIHQRRAFLSAMVPTTFALVGATTAVVSNPSLACAAGDTVTTSLKVTPIAHTFVAADGKAKPLRENDATRFLTNARVVYLMEGSSTTTSSALPAEVLQLTVARKEGKGPGVTPGAIHLATSRKDMTTTATSLGLDTTTTSTAKDAVATAASKLPPGDTLMVGPLPSGGTAVDGKLVADTAAALGVQVGGAREGGVLSVLLDGNKDSLTLVEDGYPVSTILWWSV